MLERWSFIAHRIRERLWIKPLAVCLLSILAVFLARMADGSGLGELVPHITRDSNETVLKIMAASMLVMATFAVASMVSAYASAASSATPRSFALVVADDVSQNALSAFVGAFIFSVVALVALMNGFYGRAGQFVLFALTMLAFAVVVVTFVRWVDIIARLGRLGNTVDRVEAAACASFRQRQRRPLLGGRPALPAPAASRAVATEAIGYLQHVDAKALQRTAERAGLRIFVESLTGAFCTPQRPVARVVADDGAAVSDADADAVIAAFEVGQSRAFDQDPRFGVIALSEIASRALSPAVNDPGTAVVVIGSLVRLFLAWDSSGREARAGECAPEFDRVLVPSLSLEDLFDDAFTAIARDGAATVEVAVRLQKALATLALVDDTRMRANAVRHAALAARRADAALRFPPDREALEAAAGWWRNPARSSPGQDRTAPGARFPGTSGPA